MASAKYAMPASRRVTEAGNNLKMPKKELEQHEEVDQMDLNNYKGIYANEDAGVKYTCPVTGAHFEFKDLCKRINRLADRRAEMDRQWDRQQAQKQKATEFSSSLMSEKIDNKQEMIDSKEKFIQFKNKFGE